MAPLSEEIRSKIHAARELSGRPHEMRFVAPASIPENLHARAVSHPNSTFLTYVGEGVERAHTYGDFYDWVRRLATMLYLHAGIGPGDRVATALHNHDRTMALFFAAWHLGASVAPLNVTEDDKRLAHVLAHSHAKTLCVFDDYAPRMRNLAKDIASLRTVISMESGAAASQPGEPLLRNEMRFDTILPARHTPRLEAPPAPNPDAEALVVYTSGTTGVPKAVCLSQYNLAVDADAIVRWHNLSRDSRMMCVLPIHHVNGLVVTHLAPLVCGGSTVLNRKFSAQKFFETAARHRVQVVSVVPTLLQFLLEATPPEFDARKSAPELTHLICGAGPLTVDLAARFEERFGIPVCHGYGLSETTCYACFLPAEQGISPEHTKWMRDFGYPSIGIPLDVNQMEIHNENGRALPDGEKGEIVTRGHNVMLGYHDNAQANEAAFTYGWFRSGDEGFFKKGDDGRDYFFITGRFKELIIRGGVKISPLEVDEVLNQIPGVKCAMAVGFDSTVYGEEVGAYVVRQEGSGLTEVEILDACRAALPAWMSPKAVVFGDTFPVTSTGKYQRNQLKGLFSTFRERQFR